MFPRLLRFLLVRCVVFTYLLLFLENFHRLSPRSAPAYSPLFGLFFLFLTSFVPLPVHHQSFFFLPERGGNFFNNPLTCSVLHAPNHSRWFPPGPPNCHRPAFFKPFGPFLTTPFPVPSVPWFFGTLPPTLPGCPLGVLRASHWPSLGPPFLSSPSYFQILAGPIDLTPRFSWFYT